MTVCGKIVGEEFIGDPVATFDFSDWCKDCLSTEWRKDEPQNEVGIPNVEGQPFRKEERYGD